MNAAMYKLMFVVCEISLGFHLGGQYDKGAASAVWLLIAAFPLYTAGKHVAELWAYFAPAECITDRRYFSAPRHRGANLWWMLGGLIAGATVLIAFS